MADSPVFDHTCSELERQSDLDRLEARGTVRIALKNAGLEVASVDVPQMEAVLARVLPKELASRGVEGAESVCQEIARALKGMTFDVAGDRAGAAADAIARMGS